MDRVLCIDKLQVVETISSPRQCRVSDLMGFIKGGLVIYYGSVDRFVVFQGNLTVDATVEVTEALLTAHGLRIGEEGWRNSVEAKTRTIDFAVAQKGIDIACGGSALNTLRVAKLLKPGIDVRMVGRVGKDAHGSLIRETCAREDIKDDYIQVDNEATTGICAILIERQTRDRSIVCMRGAAANLSLREALEQQGFDTIVGASEALVFATSYNLTTPNRVEFIRYLFGKAKGKVALSLSSSAILHKVKDHVQTLLPKCNILFANAGEATTWADICRIPGASLNDCTAYLAAQLAPGGCAVVTNGSKPSIYCMHSEQPVEVPHARIIVNIAGDTNGAGECLLLPFVRKPCPITLHTGDSFAGAFLAEYMAIPQPDSNNHDRIRSCVQAVSKRFRFLVRA